MPEKCPCGCNYPDHWKENAKEPVPANPSSSGVSDAPGWKRGPYNFEHVAYFADLPGLQCGTFEISDGGRTDNWLGHTLTIEQAQLFAAAPDLYAALQAYVTLDEALSKAMGTDLETESQPYGAAKLALAKARGSVPQSQTTEPKIGTGSQEKN